MRPRYLLMAAPGEVGLPPVQAVAARVRLSLAFSSPHLALFVNPCCRFLPVGEQGAIVGRLFHRDGPARPIGQLAPTETNAILDSDGRALVHEFWGGYVAAIASPASLSVLREPSGSLPCYCAQTRHLAAFASDAELLVESGVARVDLDWSGLARHFFGRGLPTSATALSGVRELLPGFAIALPGRLDDQSPIWSPWDHVPPPAAEAGIAAEQLGRTVRHCVRSWAEGHKRLLISLSGGLDSSIVAACLAEAPAEAACLTLYGEDAQGDERLFARAVSRHLRLPLWERAYRLEDVRIDRPLGRHLPRPVDRTQALPYERAHLQVAREIGADAFVTGNGGDSVFGYSQSPAVIADRVLSEGLGRGALRSLVDVCRQNGCSLFAAATRALRILRRPPAYTWRPDPLLLHRDRLYELAATRLDHPWLQAPADALPGKAAHIAALLRVQQCLEPHRSRYRPVLNPLLSQPILEACLAVPSWEWRTGGRDRALARSAFADALPRAILERRAKGGPSGFAAQLLAHFRSAIRDRLLQGHLARQSIIDTVAVESALGDATPLVGEELVRILQFVAAEAWIDSWRGRPAIATCGEHNLNASAVSRSAP